MYLVNSYLHVLKNIDSSWGDSTSSTRSRSSTRSKRRRSRNSTRSSNSHRGSHTFGSSSESGLYSEELVNSGYYGDDEVDRCRCPKCLSEAQARKPKNDFAADYEIITVDLSACSTPILETSYVPPVKETNFDEYIIIPSSKEEFLAGGLAHSTPIQEKETGDFDTSLDSPAAESRVGVNIQNRFDSHCSCKVLEEIEDSGGTCSPPRPVALQRVASNGGTCWWRENIVWQLQQRNDAQTERFLQLQSDTQRCRTKVRINKELADYLNKFAEFRPHTEASSNNALISMEVEPLDRSELVLAIRKQKTSHNEEDGDARVKSDSIAHLATTYLKRQRTMTEEKLAESEGSYSPGSSRSRMSNRAGKRDRVPSRKWRESIVNQLEMRNFLECKYFTDALVRRTMSQLSISENLPFRLQGIDEYDIITDDEVSSLDSRSTLRNSNHSTSLSQGYYSSPFSGRFFSLKRNKRK